MLSSAMHPSASAHGGALQAVRAIEAALVEKAAGGEKVTGPPPPSSRPTILAGAGAGCRVRPSHQRPSHPPVFSMGCLVLREAVVAGCWLRPERTARLSADLSVKHR